VLENFNRDYKEKVQDTIGKKPMYDIMDQDYYTRLNRVMSWTIAEGRNKVT
jgi:hypothetical protein